MTPATDSFSVQGFWLWAFFFSAVLAAVGTYDLLFVVSVIWHDRRRHRRAMRLLNAPLPEPAEKAQ